MHEYQRNLFAALTVLAASLPVGAAEAAGGPCVPPAGRYDFTIDVSGLGKVGALTGVVTTANGQTTIEVSTQIVVRIAGIVVHRHVETRHTVYRDGALAAYRADVKSNGDAETVRVTRQGGSLIGVRNGRKTTLPGTAMPGFPWARCIAERPFVFGLRTVRPSAVTVEANMPLSLRLGGREVPAREIRFVLPKGWVAWFAEDGTLLRHAFNNGGRRVTLTRVAPKK